MSEIEMMLTILACVAVALAACWSDLRTNRLPNALTFTAAAAAISSRLIVGGVNSAAWGLAGLAVGLALFLPMFVLRGMSAGDVKLLAAFGAWLGPSGVVWAAAYAAIGGGLLAIVVAIARGYLRCALSNVWTIFCHWRVAGITPLQGMTLDTSRSPRLPYAVPIAAGALLTLWTR